MRVTHPSITDGTTGVAVLNWNPGATAAGSCKAADQKLGAGVGTDRGQ